MMTWQEVETLNAGGSSIKRATSGYYCRVLVVDKWRKRVKVRDDHSPCHRYWVSFETLKAKWTK